MRRVVWAQTARADIADQIRHIAAHNPDAAQRVAHAIRKTGQALAEFATGHAGRVAGTYEKSVRGLPYIIAYTLSADDRTVAIIRVIHTARDWPEATWPE